MSAQPDSNSFARNSADDAEIIEYLPVNRCAVAACVLGCASALALTGKPFWAVPAIAVPLAFLALWQLSRSVDPMLGRKAAIAGLVLAVLFGSWAVATDRSRQQWIEKTAAEKTLRWFEIAAAGNWQEAHRLTLSHERRRNPDSDPLDNIPGHSALRNEAKNVSAYDTFLKQDVIQELQAAGPTLRARVIKTFGSVVSGASELVSQDVLAEWSQDGQTKTLPLLVVMQRNFDEQTKTGYWFVQKLEKHSPKTDASSTP